jgi:cytochrome P450
MQRSTVTEYVFKDGLRLPQHTQLAVATHELNHDGDVHENPDVFDPWRSLKKRRATGDLNRYHFAYVSDQSIGFGAGTHACPGRHFASCQIKLILIHLLTRYDIKWPEGQSRPPNIEHDFSSIPDPTATVLFREKSF